MPSQHLAVEGVRRLCALLSPFSARETLLRDWPAPAMWPSIVAQADTHRLIPALAVALDRLGAVDRLDPEAAELLARIAAWNADRNEGLRRQVHGLSRAFNAAGLQPVWLKGALALLPAAGAAGGRMMLDLDVWLPEAKDQRAGIDELEGLGYRYAVDADDPASQHYPSFFHPDEMARVELHRAILRPRDSVLLPPMEAAAGIEWQEWEGTHIGRLDALSRALCSFYQCTRPEYRPITASEVPLMKAFDFVGRIHADFGGVLPPAFLERVAMAGWEPAARRFLTLTDVYFGLPNPLAPDLAYIRAVERRAGRPRWHLTLRTMRTLLTARGWEMVRHPWRAPGQFATYVGRLWAPGGAPRF